jgi:hypothetical protein
VLAANFSCGGDSTGRQEASDASASHGNSSHGNSSHECTFSHSYGGSTATGMLDGGGCASGADCTDTQYCLLTQTPSGSTGVCKPVATLCAGMDALGYVCECLTNVLNGACSSWEGPGGGTYVTIFINGC